MGLIIFSVIAYTEYGGVKIPAIVGMDNVIGCQFHPEKSGEIGLKILKAFNLQEDYQKFDLEIRFADGTEKEYHKGNQGQ